MKNQFIHYRVYKTFSFENFKGDLSNTLGNSSDSFEEHCVKYRNFTRNYTETVPFHKISKP